jgi:hypothetical protein
VCIYIARANFRFDIGLTLVASSNALDRLLLLLEVEAALSGMRTCWVSDQCTEALWLVGGEALLVMVPKQTLASSGYRVWLPQLLDQFVMLENPVYGQNDHKQQPFKYGTHH